MKINVYNRGITRFLEYLGPGNHMGVEVSPGILNLLKRSGVEFYPSHNDPKARVTVRTTETNIPVQVNQQTNNPVNQREVDKLVDETLSSILRDTPLPVEEKKPQKKSSNPQVMRPSDMNGTNSSVRFGKQVSDAGDVGIMNESDMLESYSKGQQNFETVITSEAPSQKISAREIHMNFVGQNTETEYKNDKFKDLAEKRQRELEQGINRLQNITPVDWDSFDRQYMEARKAEESDNSAKENKSVSNADSEISLNSNDVEVEDPVSITESAVKFDADDAEIDAILASIPQNSETAFGNISNDKVVKKRGPQSRSFVVDPETAKNTKYEKNYLLTLTNKTLQSILRGRGYVKGNMSPTPFDSKETLIKKIQDTQ